MQVLWLAGETDIEWQIDDSIVQARRRYGRKPFRQTRRRSEAIGRLDSERHHDRIVVPQKFGGFKRVVRNAITRPDHERVGGAPGYAYAPVYYPGYYPRYNYGAPVVGSVFIGGHFH